MMWGVLDGLEYLSFFYTCPKLHKGQKQGLFSALVFVLTQAWQWGQASVLDRKVLW